MIFTSFRFLLFFPIVTLVFYMLPIKFRWIFLLVVSYYFYINIKPVYAILLAGITITTYTFALLIDNTKSEKWKKYLLILDIVLVLLPLFFFKYFNFVNATVFNLFDYLGIRWQLPNLDVILPIGISFYTFMALGYAIDVANEEINAEKNPGIVALFLSFFPLVLSGPIERATNMFNQFKSKLVLKPEMVVMGLKLILWGYFMKLVVADRISIYVNSVFGSIEHQSGKSLLLATLLNPLKSYGDLGGYSLIAIGCANILGISVISNFNRPFFATSLSEFWRRWHKSLIGWLTDYIYTPLSFRFRNYKIWGIVMAIMLTFIISGIWHGATLAFIIWGATMGIILSVEALLNNKRQSFEKRFELRNKKWYVTISCSITYLIFAFSLLYGGLVNSMNDVTVVLHKILTDTRPVHIDKTTLFYVVIGAGFLFLSEFRDEFYPGRLKLFDNKNVIIRWSAYLSILILIMLIGVFNGGQFIYFKF